jgi:hypothetical protein
MLFNSANYSTEEEVVTVSESLEGDQFIMEAILEDAGVQLTEDEAYDLISEQILSERSIVRLDKVAKRSLAEKKAVIVLAREANDPLYKKLVKIYKIKKGIIDQLVRKYGSRAKSRVRKNASNPKANNLIKKTAASAKPKAIFKGSDMPAHNPNARR